MKPTTGPRVLKPVPPSEAPKPPERRHHDRRAPVQSLQDQLNEADRRHTERRQYAEQPSGWTDLDVAMGRWHR